MHGFQQIGHVHVEGLSEQGSIVFLKEKLKTKAKNVL